MDSESDSARAMRYRNKAERIRREAAGRLTDQQTRKRLLDIARQYDELAASTERRAPGG